MLHEPLKLHGLESAIKPRPLTPLEGVVKVLSQARLGFPLMSTWVTPSAALHLPLRTPMRMPRPPYEVLRTYFVRRNSRPLSGLVTTSLEASLN